VSRIVIEPGLRRIDSLRVTLSENSAVGTRTEGRLYRVRCREMLQWGDECKPHCIKRIDVLLFGAGVFGKLSGWERLLGLGVRSKLRWRMESWVYLLRHHQVRLPTATVII
jgi:hypothetical protein